MDNQSWFDQNAGWIGFVSAILGAISFGLSIWFYILGRKPKQLGWRVLSKYGMIRGRWDAPKLTISYEGQELINPVATLVRIENHGKVEIRKEDWEIPVGFNFQDSRIVQAAVVDKSDGNIAATIDDQRLDEVSCSLKPMLLNQGEWFDVQLITDGPVEEPAINARIAGVTGRLGDMEAIQRKFQNRMLAAIVVGILLVSFAANSLLSVSAVWLGVIAGILLGIVGNVFLERFLSRGRT